MAFLTIKFKPWDIGQAQPMCCTFVLLRSRCLDCLSSLLSWPLIDSLFQVLWDLSYVLDSAWQILECVGAACCFHGLGLKTVSAALEGLFSLVGYAPIGFQRLSIPQRASWRDSWPHLPYFRHHSPSLSIVMSLNVAKCNLG